MCKYYNSVWVVFCFVYHYRMNSITILEILPNCEGVNMSIGKVSEHSILEWKKKLWLYKKLNSVNKLSQSSHL